MRAPTLAQVLPSGSQGFFCCCVRANGQVPRSAPAQTPLDLTEAKKQTLHLWSFLGSHCYFPGRIKEGRTQINFLKRALLRLYQRYVAPGGDGSPLQDSNQVCSCQWFKLLRFTKFKLGTSLQRMWGKSAFSCKQRE